MAATVAQIDEHFNNKSYYEALQMYRSLFARSLKKKSKHAFLMQQLERGADTLLEAQEWACAVELLGLLLDTYEAAGVAVDGARVEQWKAWLLQLAPERYADAKSATLLKRLATWSASDEAELGDPTLHDAAASQYAAAGNLQAANAHYLRGADASAHEALIRKWAAALPADERDLLYARTALQSLAFGQLFVGNQMHEAAVAELGEPSPLTNVVGFVIATIEEDRADLFTELRKRYAAAFSRDNTFSALLDSIGKKYFNIQPATPPPNIFSMLQNMMGGKR
eukprot:TRINITY_DN3383_c0_g1_i1.p1 TRINITY_DN3383_c0_g1~~TRINITY_DN3383_c0_g1_i1.p1  ORF type:complete len:296 (+),score=82.61 TRINITY_DN3383_c0_g1_i1:45-890(+)